jgi:hypothetical protein
LRDSGLKHDEAFIVLPLISVKPERI